MIPLIILFALVFIVFVSIKLNQKVRKPAETPFEVLFSRKGWDKLPKDFLEVLSPHFKSAEETKAFASCCEGGGLFNILPDNLPEYNKENFYFYVVPIVVSLTTYANILAAKEIFEEAKLSLDFVLLIRPRYVPAWCTMALVSYHLKDYSTAILWADKVLTFKPNADSNDPDESGMAEAMGLKTPRREDVIDETNQMFEEYVKSCVQVQAIKDECNRRINV